MENKKLVNVVNALSIDGTLSSKDVSFMVNYLLDNGNPALSPRDVIQIRRGDKENLSILAQGEMAFTLDTEQLFIGGLGGNIDLFESVNSRLLALEKFVDDMSIDGGVFFRDEDLEIIDGNDSSGVLIDGNDPEGILNGGLY